MAYATPTDIEERLGRTLEPAEVTQVATRLDDAEELIRLRIPDLDDRITAGTLRERLVVMVEAEAVMRLIRNPDGITQETDGNYSYSVSSAVASGRLTIEPNEWYLLGIRASIALIEPVIKMPVWPTSSEPQFQTGGLL